MTTLPRSASCGRGFAKLVLLGSSWGRLNDRTRHAAPDCKNHGRIAIESAGSLLNLGSVKFEQTSETPDTSFRIQLAYRQAGMFVAFLYETNPAGFARMMDAILDGRPFAETVTTGYEADLHTLWSRFVQAVSARP